jgi:hypothetical membrane protein
MSIFVNPSERAHILWGSFFYIIAPLQYFLAQILVAWAWEPPYNWNTNYISDLGNTACGMFTLPHDVPGYVCSPYNLVMNISFVLSGVLLIAGTILLRRFWPQDKRSTTAFVLLLIAGVGRCIVGLVPENTILPLHSIAALNIPIASVAILFLGSTAFRTHRSLAISAVVASAIGLCATFLLGAAESGYDAALLGLGYGGMERLASYPMNIWMIAVGIIVIAEAKSVSDDRKSP